MPNQVSPIGSSPMLDAFVNSAYGGWENIQKAHEDANKKRAELSEAQKIAHLQAIEQIMAENIISESMDIQSVLEKGSLNEITVPHPQFKNYDHSLEKDRTQMLREKYMEQTYGQGSTFIPNQNEIVDPQNIQMSTQEYDHIDPNTVPNLKGIFDNTFGL